VVEGLTAKLKQARPPSIYKIDRCAETIAKSVFPEQHSIQPNDSLLSPPLASVALSECFSHRRKT